MKCTRIYIIGILAFGTLVQDSFGDDQMVLRMILELPPEDTLTVTPEEVIKECTQIVANKEKHKPEIVAKVLRRRAQAYRDLKRMDSALIDAESLCKMQPNNLDARFFRALLLAEHQKTDEALKEAHELLKLDAENSLWYGILAHIYALRGDLEEGIKYVNKGLALDAKSPSCLYIRASLHFRREEFGRCLEDLNEYLNLRPFGGLVDVEDPYIMRGTALLVLDRPSDALSDFLLARKLNANSFPALWGLWAVYVRLDRWHLATKYAEEWAKARPNDPEAHSARANASAMIGREEAAIQHANRALECSPPNGRERSTTLTAVGNIYVSLAMYTEALRYFDNALELENDCYGTLRAKSTLLATCPEAKFRNGAEALKLALRANTDKRAIKSETAMLIAQAYAECGEFDKAVDFGKKAIELAGPKAYSQQELQRKVTLFEKKMPYRTPIRRPDK